MARTQLSIQARQWLLASACTPLLLLAGCPQNPPDLAATPAQATAPPLTASASTTAQPRGNTLVATQTAPPPPISTAQSVENAARAAKAQKLIDEAQRSYRSGVANYTAGHLDAARIDFDYAVDLLLTSGIDLKTDPLLADEFDHLLNAVNSLEMTALKQGNGFSPRLEAAPLEAAGDVTFPANAALTAKVAQELKTTRSDFPLVVNDYVAGFISYFSNSPAGHAHLLRSLERAGKYQGMISKILRQEGVPQDLIYLAVAESGFQPQALNARSGAAGMWQFMPFANAYGLARNGYFDERFDPEKSSRAYARYMKGLYNQFGDWYLAMAAYDWGPGYVQRAVMKTGYADFWELYRRNVLPQETKNYVPGIIAAIIMAKNPQQYGFDKLVPEAAVLSDKVTIDYSIDLRLVADVTGASVQEIAALNPSLLRPVTPRDLSFDLHIPPGTLDLYNTRLKQIPVDKRTSWRYHVVRNGESLEAIASSLHVRSSDVAEANGITAGDPVQAGDELIVPVAATLAASSSHPRSYTTRRGDTLVTIADRFNISVENLRHWNHLTTATVKPGRALRVSEPLQLGPTARNRRATTRARTASAKGKSKTASTHGKASTHASARSVHPTSSGKSHASAKPTGKRASASSAKSKRKAAR